MGHSRHKYRNNLKVRGNFAAKQGIKFEVSVQLHLAAAQGLVDFPVGSLSQFNI
jgi:hypothetical protein